VTARRNRWLWLCLLGSFLSASPAAAMMFLTHQLGEREYLIEGLGTLIDGDGRRLNSSVRAIEDKGGHIVGLTVNSPGGLLQEAGRMADIIRIKNLRVIVRNDARCLSACFLVFAAGRERAVEPDAVIGVHSASEVGSTETASSRLMTDTIARTIERYGVPRVIIDKMLATAPSKMEWLTLEDLGLMGVVILPVAKTAPLAPAPAD
jgi:hypothetical protein